MMTKTDKLIFWSVLVISCLFLLFSNLIFAKSGQKTLVIEVDGAHYAAYRLEEITKPKRIKIQSDFGSQELEITKDSVEIIKSDCKDGLCLGKLEHAGEMAVCLPNRIVVRLEHDGEVDGVAY